MKLEQKQKEKENQLQLEIMKSRETEKAFFQKSTKSLNSILMQNSASKPSHSGCEQTDQDSNSRFIDFKEVNIILVYRRCLMVSY
jgi:hypothetical protein